MTNRLSDIRVRKISLVGWPATGRRVTLFKSTDNERDDDDERIARVLLGVHELLKQAKQQHKQEEADMSHSGIFQVAKSLAEQSPRWTSISKSDASLETVCEEARQSLVLAHRQRTGDDYYKAADAIAKSHVGRAVFQLGQAPGSHRPAEQAMTWLEKEHPEYLNDLLERATFEAPNVVQKALTG